MTRTSLPTIAAHPHVSSPSVDAPWQAEPFPASEPQFHDPEPPLSFFLPERYEPGYAYPLLIWLHSDASSEHELGSVMPPLSTQNFVAVAPRGGVRASDERNVFSWRQDSRQIDLASDAVQSAVDAAARRFNVNRQRIFLAGFGGGGEMALRIALAAPEDFSGVVSINGPVPARGNPLGRLAAVRKLPILLAAGAASTLYPPHRVSRDLRLLHAAGVRLNLVKSDAGDDLTSAVLHHVNKWCMEQICPTAASAPAAS